MIEIIIAMAVGIVTGWVLSPTEVNKEITENIQAGISDTGGRNWSIYIDSTDDATVYRGIYEVNGRAKYCVEGNGVTGALRNLADEINKV